MLAKMMSKQNNSISLEDIYMVTKFLQSLLY